MAFWGRQSQAATWSDALGLPLPRSRGSRRPEQAEVALTGSFPKPAGRCPPTFASASKPVEVLHEVIPAGTCIQM